MTVLSSHQPLTDIRILFPLNILRTNEQNLVKSCPFVLKILRKKEILTLFKGCNCVTNLGKMMHNIPNLNVVNIDMYINIIQAAQCSYFFLFFLSFLFFPIF